MDPTASDFSRHIEELSAGELSEIMAMYASATDELRANQENLRGRVRELSEELAVRNQELSSRVDELSALKNYLANILESITDGVLTIDPNRRLVAVNKAASDMLSVNGGPMVREREAGDANAAPVEHVLRGTLGEIGTMLCAALERQQTFTNVEIEIQSTTGVPPRVLLVSANPIRNSAHAILGAVATFRDNTALRHLETEVRRKDRLAALGEMAAGVAHEIRNPLGGIELYASNMKRGLSPESKEAKTCDNIIRAVGSLNRIVTDMLVFTRSRAPTLRAVSLERVVASALDLAQREAHLRDIQIQRDFCRTEQTCRLDPEQMTQAILNIVLNAIQMTPEGRHVSISTTHAQNGATVTVIDDGPGVPDEIIDKIFNPFFTTREKGTGLGLAIVHKIVQDHGGQLSVENVPTRGAAFHLFLPHGSQMP